MYKEEKKKQNVEIVKHRPDMLAVLSFYHITCVSFKNILSRLFTYVDQVRKTLSSIDLIDHLPSFDP